MGYNKNPFGSSEGNRLVEEIFDLMWVRPEKGVKAIDTEDLSRQVNHYRSNIINMVNKMRKFVTGYQQVPIHETKSSGIHVCPSCTRRDFIYYWDILDAGHYSDPRNWVSSVAPATWESGMPGQKGRYLFMVRYKCNDATTCSSCYSTVKGHYSSCPECGSSNVSKVGCGTESYAKHFLREYTFTDNHPTTEKQRNGVIPRNRQVRNKSNRQENGEGRIVGYRFEPNPLPKGKVVKSQSDMERYMPSVVFTYEAFKDSRKEVSYPISEMNYAISKEEQKRCRMGKILSDGQYYHPTYPRYLSQGQTRCPSCSSSDYPPLEDIPGLYYAPSMMRIKSPQPLGSAGSTDLQHQGFPVYNIRLESTMNDEYKLLLPLPQVYTLHPIPDAPEVQSQGVMIPTCPNDVGAGLEREEVIKEMTEEIEKAQEAMNERLKSLIGLGQADQVTAPGFSFVVCEGRSRHATYDSDKAEWIDKSPECKGYGKTYPRWNQIPDYADANSNFTDYLGPNPDSHLVQDWLKASENLSEFTTGGAPTYHGIIQIGTQVNEELGQGFAIMECQTCKGIVQAGGVIPFRQSLGECDENGQSLGGFPQQVLDAEIAYENAYPKQNDMGDDVVTAWGINAKGKDLLQRKTTYKVF